MFLNRNTNFVSRLIEFINLEAQSAPQEEADHVDARSAPHSKKHRENSGPTADVFASGGGDINEVDRGRV